MPVTPAPVAAFEAYQSRSNIVITHLTGAIGQQRPDLLENGVDLFAYMNDGRIYMKLDGQRWKHLHTPDRIKRLSLPEIRPAQITAALHNAGEMDVKPHPYDHYRATLSKRKETVWNGTKEQVLRLDIDFPTPSGRLSPDWQKSEALARNYVMQQNTVSLKRRATPE
jgi:hypothetical protein